MPKRSSPPIVAVLKGRKEPSLGAFQLMTEVVRRSHDRRLLVRLGRFVPDCGWESLRLRAAGDTSPKWCLARCSATHMRPIDDCWYVISGSVIVLVESDNE